MTFYLQMHITQLGHYFKGSYKIQYNLDTVAKFLDIACAVTY